MEPIVDKLLNTLVQHFRTKIASAEGSGNLPVVNLDIVVNYFTMDVITRIAFGRELGCLESDSDVHRALGTMSAALKRYTIPLSIPWLRDITTGRLFIKFFGPKPTDKTGLGVMMGYLLPPPPSPFLLAIKLKLRSKMDLTMNLTRIVGLSRIPLKNGISQVHLIKKIYWLVTEPRLQDKLVV